MRGIPRSLVLAAVAAPLLWLSAGAPARATGNLETTNNGATIVNRVWPDAMIPIVWRYHDPNTVAGCYSSVTAPPATLQPAVAAGFVAWQDNPDSRVAFSYGGTTPVRDIGADGVNVITFCDSAVLASNQGFLAQTPTTALTQTLTVTAGGGCPAGQGILDVNGNPPPAGFCFPAGTWPPGTVIDGDVRFNSFSTFEQDFSTDNTTPGSYDVQATATHELGHFHGLSHNPIPQSVMFAFIDDVPASDGLGQRVLKPSDLITSSHYYPEASFNSSYGSITGFISLDGLDADGVHVVAIDPNTMLAYRGVWSISRFEDPNAGATEGPDFAANGAGFYRIDGLPPGSYYVYVEYFDNTEFLSGRLVNRYNLTVGNSNVSNGNATATGQVGGWLGFLPKLAEFYDAAESGHGGDGVNPGTALDNSDAASLVTVIAGAATTGINIAINIEPVNGQTAVNRQNPTTRTTVVNDAPLTGDSLTGFLLNGGADDFYAIRYPAASLPAPPYNIAEGLWARAGRVQQNMVVRLAFEDPAVPGRPAFNDPIVASAGRVLTGGVGGLLAAGDFIDVRDQWNVTVNQSRDIWVIINQPGAPAGTTLLTQGYFALVSTPQRVARTLVTQNGGGTWGTLNGDAIYDLIVEADPPVTITSASPASLTEGDTANVDVFGTGFRTGAAVDFGPGITVNTTQFLSATQLRCNVTVNFTGATASRGVNVKVTNPNVVFPNVSRVFTVLPAVDTDLDGVPDAQDCSPGNGTLKHAATEVLNLLLTDSGVSAQLAWDTQDGINGSATVYDVATGLIGDLAATRNYSMAACGVNDHPDTPFTDSTVVPSGQIRWWLVRARNTCNAGPGTYGDSSLMPDPRDALDSAGPCP